MWKIEVFVWLTVNYSVPLNDNMLTNSNFVLFCNKLNVEFLLGKKNLCRSFYRIQ